MPANFPLSEHAVFRMAQRNLSCNDIEYVLSHGKRIWAAGVATYFLGKRDIPRCDRNNSKITRLEGTLVLVKFLEDGNFLIITAYRNRGALKASKRKAKYDNKKTVHGNLPLAE